MARTQQERAEADAKFFALRESGYTGGIDQDGNKDNRYDAAFARLAHDESKSGARKK